MLRIKRQAAEKGTQIRETTGFERTFSAHTAQKNPEIRLVFPDFSFYIVWTKNLSLKTALHAKIEIFVADEAKSTGILK